MVNFKRAVCFKNVLSFPLASSTKDRIRISYSFFESTDEEFEQIKDQVLEYFSKYKKESDNELFFILFAHFLYVRPKRNKFLMGILTYLNYQFPSSLENRVLFCARQFKNIPKMNGLVDFISRNVLRCSCNDLNGKYQEQTNEQNNNHLFCYLKNDDLQKLQNEIYRTAKFDYSQVIEIKSGAITEVLNEDKFNLLKTSAFFGSMKCFKFLISNENLISNDLCFYAAAGGNIVICNMLDGMDKFFQATLKTAVFFHQHIIADWILQHYQTDPVPLDECLFCNNEIAFFYFYSNLNFMLLNYDTIKKSLLCTIDFPEYEIVKLLIDLRPQFENNELLIKECESPFVNHDILRLFIAADMDVNEMIDDKTPLSALCGNINANEKMVQLLLDFLADANLCDPLIKALSNTSPKLNIIKQLIGKGAVVDHNKPVLEPEDLLSIAIRNTNISADIIEDICTLKSKTPLYTAKFIDYLCELQNPQISIIKILLKYGKDVDKNVYNPLHKLCKQLNITLSLVDFFVNNGFNISEIRNGTTPFISLCCSKYVNFRCIGNILRNGIDLNQIVDSKTVMEHICECQDVRADVVKYIIYKGENIQISPILYNLCLKDASKRINVIEILIDKADVNELVNGVTPFYALCRSNDPNIDIIEMFILKGANVNEKFDDPKYVDANNNKVEVYNDTPFKAILLNKNANDDVKELFLVNSAKLSKEDVKCITDQCQLDLDLVNYLIASNDELPQTQFFYNLCCNKSITLDIVKFVIEEDFDINRGPNTPIAGLCKNNFDKEDIIKYLINAGANLNMGSNTPLYNLCKNEKVKINLVLYLIEKGADVNLGKYTPLFALCTNKEMRRDIFDLLIDNDADPNAGQISAFSKLCNSPFMDINLIKKMIINGAKITSNEHPLKIACANPKITPKILDLLLDRCVEEKNLEELNFAMEFYLQNCTLSFEIIHEFIYYLYYKFGADVNKNNPLFYILSKRSASLDEIKWMIEFGADINIQNALFAACSFNRPKFDIIKFLVEKGADINKPYNGCTPLKKLLSSFHVDNEVIDYLKQHGAVEELS